MERRSLLKSSSPRNYHSCLRDNNHHTNSRYDQERYRWDSEEARPEAACQATDYKSSLKINGQETSVPAPVSSPAASSSKLTHRPENHSDHNVSYSCSPDQDEEDTDAGEHKESVPQVPVIRNKKKRIFLVSAIAFLCSCASMIHSPLMEQYIYQVFSEEVFGNISSAIHVNKEPCINSTNSSVRARKTDQVQDQSGDFQAHLTLIDGGIAIIANLFLGAYSDVLGRKMSLFLPIFGHFVRNAAAPVIIYFDLGLPGMYVGYIVDGLFGGSFAILMGTYAYTADITEKGSQRTISLTVVAVSIGLAKCMLGAVAGLFIEETGFFIPSIASSAFLLVAAFLVCFLPETLSRDPRERTSPLEILKRMITTFFPCDHLLRAMLLLGLAGFFISTLPEMAITTLDALYLMKEPFCWGSLQQGILITARDTSSYLAAFTVIRLFTKVVSDPVLSIIGLISEMGRCISMALAKDDLTLYATVVSTGILRRAIFSPMRAFMSSLVPSDRQGTLFAGIAVIECVSECVGKTAMVGVYKDTLTFMPGFVYLVVAAFNFVAGIVFAINWCFHRKFKASRVIVLNIQGPVKNTPHDKDQPSTGTT